MVNLNMTEKVTKNKIKHSNSYQWILPVDVDLLKHLSLYGDLVPDVLGAEDGLQVEPGRLHLQPRVQGRLHAVLKIQHPGYK